MRQSRSTNSSLLFILGSWVSINQSDEHTFKMNSDPPFPHPNSQTGFNACPTLPQLRRPFIYQHPSHWHTPPPPSRPMQAANCFGHPLTGSPRAFGYVQPELQWTRHSLGKDITLQTCKPSRSRRRHGKTRRRVSIARRRHKLHPAHSNATFRRQPVLNPYLTYNAPYFSLGPEVQTHFEFPLHELLIQPGEELPYEPVLLQPEQLLDDETTTNLIPFTETTPTAWYDFDPWLEVEVPIEPVVMDKEVEEIKRIMGLIEEGEPVRGSRDTEIRSRRDANSGCQ